MATKKRVKDAKTVKDYVNSNKSSDINYSKTILCAILIIVLVIGGYLAYQFKDGKFKDADKKTTETKVNYTEDEKKFKKEYESLNDQYEKISIIDDNNIKYISLSDANKMIKEQSGIIYFGYAKSNDSRNVIVSLLKAMESTSLDTIYYVDIENVRDEYELNIKGNAAVKKTDASNEYIETLSLLKKYLPDYQLKNTAGRNINVGEKRLVDPTIVSVQDGKIKDVFTGVLSSKELDQKMLDIVDNYLSDSCPVDEPVDC